MLADAPYGWVIFTFDLLSTTRLEATDFGDGRSPLMDASDFIGALARFKHAQPNPRTATRHACEYAAKELRIAAAGLREAIKYYEPGESLPPEHGVWLTPYGAAVRAAARRQLRYAHVLKQIEGTLSLADDWGQERVEPEVPRTMTALLLGI